MFIQGHNHHIRGESGLVILNGNEIIRGGCGGKGYPSCSAREGGVFRGGGGGGSGFGKEIPAFWIITRPTSIYKIVHSLKKKKAVRLNPFNQQHPNMECVLKRVQGVYMYVYVVKRIWFKLEMGQGWVDISI